MSDLFVIMVPVIFFIVFSGCQVCRFVLGVVGVSFALGDSELCFRCLKLRMAARTTVFACAQYSGLSDEHMGIGALFDRNLCLEDELASTSGAGAVERVACWHMTLSFRSSSGVPSRGFAPVPKKARSWEASFTSSDSLVRAIDEDRIETDISKRGVVEAGKSKRRAG